MGESILLDEDQSRGCRRTRRATAPTPKVPLRVTIVDATSEIMNSSADQSGNARRIKGQGHYPLFFSFLFFSFLFCLLKPQSLGA